jgi:hypothetical protein
MLMDGEEVGYKKNTKTLGLSCISLPLLPMNVEMDEEVDGAERNSSSEGGGWKGDPQNKWGGGVTSKVPLAGTLATKEKEGRRKKKKRKRKNTLLIRSCGKIGTRRDVLKN